jgi:hypothetical protein
MSDYSITTDFAAKDALTTGDANKIVKGTEITAELQAIRTAVNSKADTVSPTLTGTPLAPTASSGTNTTQIATTAFVTTALQALYPVGSIYINASVSTNPGTLLGFGTWSAYAAGRVLVGFNSSNSLFDTAEETGGSADAIVVSHTHSVTDSGHAHNMKGGFGSVSDFVGGSNEAYGAGIGSDLGTDYQVTSNTTGISIASTGSSGTNANYQPYITVYMWKRTA